MYLKLPADYVDPRSAAPLPDAAMMIVGADFSLGQGRVILQTAVFASADAAAVGAGPMSTDNLILTPSEVSLQQPAILTACYSILLLRPEFAGTSLVPPEPQYPWGTVPVPPAPDPEAPPAESGGV